jgi:NADPH:quinone reductase-like Zn-dependent oxidoreductase
MVSGLTASIALSEQGRLKAEERVLVTAAAGGAGHLAVQWARLKGARNVIGTCSTAEKESFLKVHHYSTLLLKLL